MAAIKKLMWCVLGLIALVGIGVALAPTVVNTGWGQKRVLAVVNGWIPGHLDVRSLGVSWLGSQTVEGLVLSDPQGQVILSVDKLSLDSPLWELLIHRGDVGASTLKELNGNIVMNPAGYTNLEEALLKDRPAKKMKIVPSQLPLALTHVNAQFSQLSSNKPFSVHLTGQTKQGSLAGSFEVDLLLSDQEKAHFKANIVGFPVDILDDILLLNKPELRGIFRELLGSQLNLTIADAISTQGQAFDLAFSTGNVQGAFKGQISDKEIRLIQPGQVTVQATPALFDQMIAYGGASSPGSPLSARSSMALKKATALNIQIEDLTYLLQSETDPLVLKAAAQMESTHLTTSDMGLLAIDSFDIRLDVAKKAILTLAASGIHNGEPFHGDAAFTFATPLSPLEDIQGKVNVYAIPMRLAGLSDVVGKEATLTVDLSAGLRDKGWFHVSRLNAYLKGSQASLSLWVDPLKLNLRDISLSTLNLKGYIQADNIYMPNDVAVNGLQVPWEFNAGENRIKMELNGTVSKGSEKASPLHGTLLIENWIQDGKVKMDRIRVSSNMKVEQIPTPLLNPFMGSLDATALIGESLDLTLIGAFDLGKQMPGTMDIALRSRNLTMKGTLFIQDGALQVKEGQPLAVTWTVTPTSWIALRNVLMKTPAEQDRLHLNEETPIALQIESLFLPFQQTNVIVDNGLKGTLTVRQLNVTDKKTKEVLHIDNLQADITTPAQTDAIQFALKADPSMNRSRGEAKVAISGSVRNLYDSAGKFDTGRLSCDANVDCKQVPVAMIGALLAMDESAQARVGALIGDKVNVDADVGVQQMTGAVTAAVHGELGQAKLDGQIKSGILTLNKPLVFQVKVTPQLGQTILNDFVPILGSAVSSSEPIKIIVDPRGFSFPLTNFDILRTQLPYMTLALGKITFMNQGELRAIMSLLKLGDRDQLSIWFTPLYVSLQDGVILCQRMDMLVADEYPIAVWGKVDLGKDKVKMTVGLGERALRRAFHVRGLDKNYLVQLSLTGSTGNVHIDQRKAAAYIAAVVAQTQKLPAGQLLGTVLQIAGSGFSDPTPPEPTTKPLPWADQFPDEAAQDKKAPIPDPEDLVKEVTKGASKLLNRLFK